MHGIVQQACGHIAVESEVRRGTTIRVYLPSIAATSDGAASFAPMSLPAGAETILLVEDQEAVRTLAARVLRGCGYTVLEAANGKDGLTSSGGHPGPIDLLVSDVVMPLLSGRELAELVVEERPAIKVLFISGYADDALIRHGVQEAEIAFLRKPFTPVDWAGRCGVC